MENIYKLDLKISTNQLWWKVEEEVEYLLNRSLDAVFVTQDTGEEWLRLVYFKFVVICNQHKKSFKGMFQITV